SFLNNWFGANPPAGIQIGNYTGTGLGLSTGGDGVNLFDSIGTLRASVSFGGSPLAAPFKTFDNSFGLNGTTVSRLSAVDIHGAFVAVNSTNEIGSPGTGGKLVITEVAPWSSSSSPLGADWFEISNDGATSVDLTGWKMDDNSQSPVGAVPLAGITNIAPGESVIFIETNNLASAQAAFRSLWFGASSLTNVQIGSYSGSGVDLDSAGDAVNIYSSNGVLRASVSFAASPVGPFATFDNGAGRNNTNLPQLSAIGINGAFIAVNDTNEIGSPGIMTVPALTITASGSNAILRWSPEAIGYRLENSWTVGLAGSWAPVIENVQLTNGQNSIIVPLDQERRFFRLKKP
ncbi:MAG: lamin tail domain-containing protein, partial [Akkermansiaceae bacterium]|nr:lamin tail domain-containing protein [Verrucomicrobiales bacterium]